MKLSERLQEILPSATLSITAKANALKKEGIDVVGFGAGEPDFDTPAPIKAAAVAALDEGFTKYTPTAGTIELRQAIVNKFKEENGLAYAPSQVIVSCGAKHSLFNVFQAVIQGDAVAAVVQAHGPSRRKLHDRIAEVTHTHRHPATEDNDGALRRNHRAVRERVPDLKAIGQGPA